MAIMNRVLAAIGIIRHDLRRIGRGTEAFFRYVFSKEDLTVGLGLFSAASNIATKGKANQYVVRIANAGRNCAELLLSFHIQAANLSVPSQGHYASFTKKLSVHPSRSSTLTIQYDWMAHADFQVDGALSLPDEFSRGKIDTPHLYSVTVLLCDSKGTQLDALTIYQELTD
jgi:hypothetical protein